MLKVDSKASLSKTLCLAVLVMLCSGAQSAFAIAHNVSCQPNCPAGTSSNNPELSYDDEDQSCLPVTRCKEPNVIICVEVHDDDDGEKDGEACCMPNKKVTLASDFADEILAEIAK